MALSCSVTLEAAGFLAFLPNKFPMIIGSQFFSELMISFSMCHFLEKEHV